MYKSKVQLFAILFLLLSLILQTGCTQNQNKLGKETRDNQITTEQNKNWDIKVSLEKTPSGMKPEAIWRSQYSSLANPKYQ